MATLSQKKTWCRYSCFVPEEDLIQIQLLFPGRRPDSDVTALSQQKRLGVDVAALYQKKT